MYCPIPKAACSTWTTIVANNSNSKTKLGYNEILKLNIHENIHRFDGLKRGKFNRNLHKSYKKFMIIRNPFDRLVSAYKDKAFPIWNADGKLNSYYYRPIQNFALKNFPHSHLSSFERKWYNATFNEFVHYILSHDDVP